MCTPRVQHTELFLLNVWYFIIVFVIITSTCRANRKGSVYTIPFTLYTYLIISTLHGFLIYILFDVMLLYLLIPFLLHVY